MKKPPRKKPAPEKIVTKDGIEVHTNIDYYKPRFKKETGIAVSFDLGAMIGFKPKKKKPSPTELPEAK